MNRASFVGALAAATVATPLHALAASFVGTRLTQRDLFAALPVPSDRAWVRVVMGSGVQYQKQIGLGVERTSSGQRLFVETQIGEAGGIACNPNTLKKTYVRDPSFHALIRPYPVLAMIARSGNTITRWADVEGGQPQNAADAHLRLLDAAYLYGSEPLTIRSLSPVTVHIAGVAHAATHVIADVAPGSRLRRIELWHTSNVPFGVARYRASVADLEPFELVLGSYGATFRTDLPQSLETLRAMTPDGMNVAT